MGAGICAWISRIPDDLAGTKAFRDGRVLSFMLHKAGGTINLDEMELQTGIDRVSGAIRGAKTQCGVPALLSPESIVESNMSEHLLLTYLFAFRTCVAGADGPHIAPAEKLAPKKGKFNTIRGGSSQTRAGLDTFESGPEHSELKCPVCDKNLVEGGLLVKDADLVVHHADCFTCKECGKSFDAYYWPFQGENYCFNHYLQAASLQCAACKKQILEDAVLVHGRKFHGQCWVCCDCGEQFESSYNLLEGKPYCSEHYKKRAGVTCSECGLEIIGEQAVKALGGLFHRNCFACHLCATTILRRGLAPLPFVAENGLPVCVPCHTATSKDVLSDSCGGCGNVIGASDCMIALKQKWHRACFVCTKCQSVLSGSYYNVEGNPYDEKCARAL